MDKKTLQQEKEYLANAIQTIKQSIDDSKVKVNENEASINEYKSYFSENYNEIDQFHDEIADLNLKIENLELANQALIKLTNRLSRQKSLPYFGRFDFQAQNEEKETYYIGLGHVRDKNDKNIVYDWRADISSLYYDDTIGKTSYTCPDGEIKGDLSLKRQYKIEKGKLKYYIDSSLVIDDNILMEELSKNSTAKMHDIVSTIQKEQNELIRSNDLKNLIVHGVAGSGKTSVALHRVSYLLYKYRGTLKNEDILILSPSQLFADYIDEVLPSLGEDRPLTTTFAQLAKKLYGKNFETRDTLLDKLITSGTQTDFENVAIKYSFEFLEAFKNFLNNDICNLFVPKTLVFGNLIIQEDEIRDIYYNRLKGLPVHKRIEAIAEHIVDLFNIPPSKNMDFFERAKKILYSHMVTTDCLRIYNIFLRSVELDEIEEIGAYDIAQILLIKENIFSLQHNYDAKYVIIDEMQDYTPCHFYLFEKIWDCPKMFLGDIHQSIDKSLTDEYMAQLAKETKSKVYNLTKSYRSTMQISKFSQKILGKKVANNVNRNGEEVQFVTNKNYISAIEKIITREREKNSGQTICIICKDKKEIETLQEKSAVIRKFTVLSENSKSGGKNLITTVISAKGVEFDCVIVPFANDDNYKSQLDRNLLYVACTRALHMLYFVADKKPSRFLTKSKKIK